MLSSNTIFHDMSKEFVSPLEPMIFDTVTIRLRVGRNQAKEVILKTDEESYEMNLFYSTAHYDYYEARCQMSDVTFSYYFHIKDEDSELFYDFMGAHNKKNSKSKHTYFRLFPGFETPKWARSAVMYQIFVERFCNGDKKNDVQEREYFYNQRHVHKVDNWDDMPDPVNDSMEFFGGDLQGVIDKLDYLHDLGIDVIYLNPIFVSPSCHKYDTQDYDHIDPHFGVIIEDGGDNLPENVTDNQKATRYIKRVTSIKNLEASDELFARLVQKAHEKGMKVILDGVFNHCGSFNKWLDKEKIYGGGAYKDKESSYKSFFKFKKNSWPDNNTYDGWWGYDTLPKLNYEGSKKLQEYILRIGRKWVSEPYNADGWRLDVAADLGHSMEFNHEFWKRFKKAVKDANPNAVILAENYGTSRSWLKGDEWDTVMNYDAFMEPVTWFLTGEEKHSDEFKKSLLNNTKKFWNSMRKATGENFNYSSMNIAMNELSNHDHSRFLTRTNHVVGRSSDENGFEKANSGVRKSVMREAVVLQMTWTGAPTLYYGDEAGMCGYTDPDNRRTYPWGHEDMEMIRFHKDIISIHKKCEEIKYGALIALGDENVKGFLAYGRFNEKNASLVLINNNEKEIGVNLDVTGLEIPDNCQLFRMIFSNEEGYDTMPFAVEVVDGKLNITLPIHCAMVLRYVEEMSDTEKKDRKMMNFE
ncbi:glycoside hydrolase family 13 protein [Butyrivibrio sp. NC3005]|uniref:glycoside hydrolase family 13 protein n=1 Tax=Butyrivibrio sp. NC3005 TaxID=1280685 RepID=UPI00040E0F92|nr:glycoside hydrolase family 13 protein [Butyrivibrio sp. NC3005]